MKRWHARVATLVVVLATGLVFALFLPRFRFSTKITDFLPDDNAKSAQIAAMLAQSEMARVMVIDLSLTEPAPEPDRLRSLAQGLITFLRADADVAIARSGLTEGDVTAIVDFLESWPPTTFLPASAYTDDAIRTRLSDLRDQLGGPMGVVVRKTAPRDPLGGMWEPLNALRGVQSGAVIDDDGVLFTADLQHAFVFVETKSSTFDSDAQRAFRARLEAWRMQFPTARLQTAGTAQFAIASEQQIKSDVNRIGTISTVGMILVFLALFGSIRMILIGFVPMLFGSAVAVLACELIYGEVHGITIAFGTSLLGVGLDYVEHYYAHFVLTPSVPAEQTMKEVAPSLAVGALTTIIGFVGIGAAGLMGLRQMAVFSVIAIAASMVATYWIVPPWMPSRYKPPPTLGFINRTVLRMLAWLTRRRWGRRARALAIVLASVGTVAALYGADFSDNVNMLVNNEGPHVREDRAVRTRLGADAGTFAVVTAQDDDALLVALGSAGTELEQARAHGQIKSYVPLDRVLPSRHEQEMRLAAARSAVPRMRSIMAELDFVPDQFAEYWDALAAATPKFLSLAEVRRSPIAPLVAAWLPAEKTHAVIIPLFEVRDVRALRASVPSATIIVPAETITDLFHAVRVKTLIASLIGFAAIWLLLFARYRDVRKVLIALTPALLACIATIGALVAVGISLTILHVMALLLVVSLGVDFGIFFVDTAATAEESARTMVSIITASVTTILSFGLLASSQSPGLAALGLTVTLGVTFSMIACLVLAAMTGHDFIPKDAAP